MTNNLLATIASPADLRRLSRAELRTLCDEGYAGETGAERRSEAKRDND